MLAPAPGAPGAPLASAGPSTRYKLATASRRSAACFFNLLFMTFVAVGLGTLFVYSDVVDQSRSFYDVMRSFFVRDSVSAATLDAISVDQWRLIGFALCTWVAYFIYFDVVPFFTRGRTLFGWIFFTRTVELKNATRFFWHLLLRDLFVWIIPITLGVIVVLATPSGNLAELFANFSFDTRYSGDVGAIVFKTLYGGYVVAALVLIVYMFVKSKRLALHDQMTHTAVVMSDAATIIPATPQPVLPNDLSGFPGGSGNAAPAP